MAATLLGEDRPGCYKYQNRVLSPTQMRRHWLTGLIREVHTASQQTYGSRQVHAELRLGMGVRVSERRRPHSRPVPSTFRPLFSWG